MPLGTEQGQALAHEERVPHLHLPDKFRAIRFDSRRSRSLGPFSDQIWSEFSFFDVRFDSTIQENSVFHDMTLTVPP